MMTFSNRRASVSVAIACSLALSACAARHPKEEVAEAETETEEQAQIQAQSEAQAEAQIEAEAPVTLGQSQISEGKARVQSEEQVTQRVMREAEVPTVRVIEEKADLNRMDSEQFAALGVPFDVARRVVDYRTRNGDFKSVDELRAVEGMNDEIFNSIKDVVTAQSTG